MDKGLPDLTSPEYSRFSPEQKRQIRELYSGTHDPQVDAEGLKNSLEAEWKNTPPRWELPRHNPDGTRRHTREFYYFT